MVHGVGLASRFVMGNIFFVTPAFT